MSVIAKIKKRIINTGKIFDIIIQGEHRAHVITFTVEDEEIETGTLGQMLSSCYFYLLYKRKGDETTQIPIALDKVVDDDTIELSFSPTSYFSENSGAVEIQIIACGQEQDFSSLTADMDDLILWSTANAQIQVSKSQLGNSQTIIPEDMFTQFVAQVTDMEDDLIEIQATAKDWANKTDGTVDGQEYSAKHYAQEAAKSKIASVSEQYSYEDAGTNTITITYADGSTQQFTVRNGSKGSTGATGPQGPKGDTGAKGDQGIQGPVGPQGIQGVQGEKGETGEDFHIAKTYISYNAMVADFANMNEGDFVLISSTPEDPDNAKMYVRTSSNWNFLADLSGAQGVKGDKGDTGAQGIQGPAGTIEVGTVTTGAAGSNASVTNRGTASQAILDFTIPKGDKGAKGDTGEKGDTGAKGDTGDAAGFGTPSIAVQQLPEGSTPTATVSASGPNTAKEFSFNFGIPTGGNSWEITFHVYEGQGTATNASINAYRNGTAFVGTLYARIYYGSSYDNPQEHSTTASVALSGSPATIYIGAGLLPSNVSFTLWLYEDSARTKLIGTRRYELGATAVASGDNGYTTGDQVYTALQSAGNDVWEVKWPRVQKVTFSGTYMSGTLYKNGVVYSGSVYYYSQYGGTSASMVGNSGNATASSSGQISVSIGAESIYNNNSYRYFVADLYSDSNKTKYLTSIFVTRALTASAITSGDNGYTTGDQVYTALQSAGNDVWVVSRIRARRGDFVVPSISGYIYKNGQPVSNTQFTGTVVSVLRDGDSSTEFGFTVTTNGSGGFYISRTEAPQIDTAFTNKNISCFNIIFKLNNTFVCGGSIYSYAATERTSDISANTVSFARANDVYNYVENKIGDINTILQSI